MATLSVQSPSTAASFQLLYPDVDPARALPLRRGERLSLALSVAILGFGAVTGDLIYLGAGALLALGTALWQSRVTARRIRAEARSRFPQLPWAEDLTIRVLRLPLLLPLIWAIIIALCVGGFWWIPDAYALSGGLAIAAVVFALVWFMPGLHPWWSKRATMETTRASRPTA